jgi:glycosyltransferase involved in cell wall biosynthesis
MANYCVYINGRFLTQEITGVQRYALEVIKSLDYMLGIGEISKNKYSVTLLIPRHVKYKPKLKHIHVKSIGRLKGHIWEQSELLYYSRNGLLLNLCNSGPIFKSNQIITIHDAAVYAIPHTFSLTFRTWYKFLLKRLAAHSKRVITDSNFSKKEIIKHTRISAEKVRIIYLGKEHLLNIEMDNSILLKHNLKHESFILAVSSMNPNKNFQSIVKAIKILGNNNIEVVIAGGRNSKVFGQLNNMLSANVKELGYITDNELKSLYENALCFVYPSFYEGFGLPPLEAMACGCPVIVSNAASLPEVCGDAALYCDPHSPEDIADKIFKLINNKELRDSLSEKGLKRSKQFTWEKCAEETMEVIEEVLSR